MKVCTDCFNDLELKQFIVSNSIEKGDCSYFCDSSEAKTIEIHELLDFFNEFIGIFKNSKKGSPICKLIQEDWNLFSSEHTCARFLDDVLKLLGSTIKNSETRVDYIDEIFECTIYWETLKEDLKWKFRFLTNIDQLIDYGWDGFFNKKIVLPQSQKLYRARLHFNGEKVPFEIENMGCPEKKNTKSGRANPQGIPYLYLSKSIDTTLYEIRATYLDDISIGTFKIKENSKVVLVDFTEEISAFLNQGNIVGYSKSMLLKKYISADLSKPIRRHDSELEYVPTQFICEFIRYITGADGILYNSSLHQGGKNIVLFEQNKINCVAVDMHKIDKILIESSKYPQASYGPLTRTNKKN